MKDGLIQRFREGLAAGFGALATVYAGPQSETGDRRNALRAAVSNANTVARRTRRSDQASADNANRLHGH